MTEAAVYSESTKKLIQRYLALSYYLYCLQLAALYQFFITFAIEQCLSEKLFQTGIFLPEINAYRENFTWFWLYWINRVSD